MNYIRQINEHTKEIDRANISVLVNLIQRAQKIHLFGNGGSAAICSHVAVDLTKACDLVALSYHDPSLLTCFSNDYGYENAYAKVIGKFVSAKDCVVLISSSGESENILRAADATRKKGASLVTLSGFDAENKLSKKHCDTHFYVNSNNYNLVETLHQIILLQAVELLMAMK